MDSWYNDILKPDVGLLSLCCNEAAAKKPNTTAAAACHTAVEEFNTNYLSHEKGSCWSTWFSGSATTGGCKGFTSTSSCPTAANPVGTICTGEYTQEGSPGFTTTPMWPVNWQRTCGVLQL